MKPYIIFSRELCGLLLLNGCTLLDVQNNKRYLKQKVYIFEYTAKLIEIMEKYKDYKQLLKRAI